MTAVCIFGVGAIGGYVGARLAQSGVKVTGICRGAQLETIRNQGLTLIEHGRRDTVSIRAVGSTEEAGPQTLVFLAVRAVDLPGLAAVLRPLLGQDTVVVTLGSGFPWWYFYRVAPGGVSPTLASVDSRGALWRMIGPEHALGCVVYPAVRTVAPGVVEHLHGNQLSIGEPDGSVSARVNRVSGLLQAAGIEAPVRQDIRTELWTRLSVNAALDLVGVLTGATPGQMIEHGAAGVALCAIMHEMSAVAQALGVRVPLQPERLLEMVRPFGMHKTPMQRDFEARRPLEIDAAAGAVSELARLAGVRTPVLDAVLAMARLRTGRSSGQG